MTLKETLDRAKKTIFENNIKKSILEYFTDESILPAMRFIDKRRNGDIFSSEFIEDDDVDFTISFNLYSDDSNCYNINFFEQGDFYLGSVIYNIKTQEKTFDDADDYDEDIWHHLVKLNRNVIPMMLEKELEKEIQKEIN